MTESTIIVGAAGSGKSLHANAIAEQHLAAGGRVTHDVAEAVELVNTGGIAGQPTLLVIDEADILTNTEWESVARVAGRGRRARVSVLIVVQRLEAVPMRVREYCELLVTAYRGAGWLEHTLRVIPSRQTVARIIELVDGGATAVRVNGDRVTAVELEPAAA